MKKTIQHISLLLAVLLTAGLSSCIKDDYADTSKDTATVNLVFSTRQVDVTDANARINEGIKTLRVILVQDGKVIENYKATGLGTGDTPLLSQTITFWQIPKAQSTFYAIANEESIDGLGTYLAGYSKGSDFGTDEDTELRGHVIVAQTGTIPGDADAIATNGLPIAGIQTADLTNATDNQSIVIPITRAVAKMELTLTNATGKEFALNQISFGKFFADQTCLFPDQATLTPGYEAKSFNPSATLTASGEGQTQTFTYYFYESNAGKGAYTIALNGGSDYAAAPIMVDGTPLASIARNTQLKVTGTIESLLEPVVTNLQLVVIPWGKKEITVPPFE